METQHRTHHPCDWLAFHPTLLKAAILTPSYASYNTPMIERQIGIHPPDSLLPGGCNSTAGSPRKACGEASEWWCCSEKVLKCGIGIVYIIQFGTWTLLGNKLPYNWNGTRESHAQAESQWAQDRSAPPSSDVGCLPHPPASVPVTLQGFANLLWKQGCCGRLWGLCWGKTALSQLAAQPSGQAWTETKSGNWGLGWEADGRKWGEHWWEVWRPESSGALPPATLWSPPIYPVRWGSNFSDELVATICRNFISN